MKYLEKHNYCLLFSPNIQALIDEEAFPPNFTFHLIPGYPSDVFRGRKAVKEIKKIEANFQPDVVFTLFGPSYWKPEAPHFCGYALPHLIYEESPFFKLIPLKEKLKWKLIGFIKFRLFKHQCNYFVTETDDVAKRLAAKLSIPIESIFTVHNAYNAVFDDLKKWTDVSEEVSEVEGFKLITISKFRTNKNQAVIPDVINYICERYPGFKFRFILTVDENQFGNLSQQQKNHMLCLGRVDINECPRLYEHADALFLPTLLECFTASYLEAMKMLKPILTSDLSFAHDVCQDAAEYFDPVDPAAIGEKIVALAKNKTLQDELIQKGRERLKDFGTAKDRARDYLEILEKVAEKNKN